MFLLIILIQKLIFEFLNFVLNFFWFFIFLLYTEYLNFVHINKKKQFFKNDVYKLCGKVQKHKLFLPKQKNKSEKKLFFIKNIKYGFVNENCKVLKNQKGLIVLKSLNKDFLTKLRKKLYILFQKLIIKISKYRSYFCFSFLYSIILNEKVFLDKNIIDLIKKSAIAQFFSISGFHLTLFSNYFFLLFYFLNNIFLNSFLFIFVFFYYLCIPTASLLRVLFMLFVRLLFLSQGLKINIWKNIFYSFLISVLINPENIVNPAFQMSYLATIIFLLSKNKFRASLNIYFCFIPIYFYYFGFFYPLSIIKSFFFSFIMEVIIYLSISSFLFFFSEISRFLSFFLDLIIKFLIILNKYFDFAIFNYSLDFSKFYFCFSIMFSFFIILNLIKNYLRNTEI